MDSDDEEEQQGPPSDAAERPGQSRKWWHVPDQRIEELIRGEAHAATSSAGSSPLSPTVRGSRSSALLLGGSGSRRSRHFGSPVGASRGTRSQRAVHFGGDEAQGDALDRLLRRTFDKSGAQEEKDDNSNDPGDKPDKWWIVSDERIRDLVLQMSGTDESIESALESNVFSANISENGTKRSEKSSRVEKISINIYLVKTGDTLTVRVPPQLRVGPSRAPPSNRFTDMYGQGASTKGFASPRKTFDYRYRKFGSTQRPGWTPQWTPSLKGLMENLIDIEPDRQMFSFNNLPLGQDELTLGSYGIKDGDTLRLRVPATEQRRLPVEKDRKETQFLASTRRKIETLERQRQQEASGIQSDMPSLRDSKHLSKCKANGDIWMMPRWIHNHQPRIFAKVGIAIDEFGGMSNGKPDFESAPIYLPDAHDSHLSRVREAVSGHTHYMHGAIFAGRE